MKDGVMTYVPRKTKYKRIEASIKPVLAPLAEAIRRTPSGLSTFIVTAHGVPFTDKGFGGRFRDWSGGAAPVHRARPEKSRRHDLRQHGGDRPAAHGAVRLDEREAGERLHAEGEQDETRRRVRPVSWSLFCPRRGRNENIRGGVKPVSPRPLPYLTEN